MHFIDKDHLFQSTMITNRSMMLTCEQRGITIDLSRMSFETASNKRLIAAHRLLVGNDKTPGILSEETDNHNRNALHLKRIEKDLELLENIQDKDSLIKFIKRVLIDENRYQTLDMHGEAGKAIEEWNLDSIKRLKEKTFEICYRDKKGFSTGSTRRLLQREHFLDAIHAVDIDDINIHPLKAILGWNLEFDQDSTDKECFYSFFRDTISYLKSKDPNITGAEDEINIRLQRKMEKYLWKKLPNIKFRIDSFSEEEHPVVIKEKDSIKEVIISPELAYSIIRGKTSFLSTKYFNAIDTVMCYL